MNHGIFSGSMALGAVLLVCGCGGSATGTPGAATAAAQANDPRGPEEITAAFLEAVRQGDDVKTSELLTPVAREKTAENELVVAPPGSETATFAIRDCILVGDDGAHVACDWIDANEDGQMQSTRFVWMLRKEAHGWRIAGMATKVFDDRPPVVLNFEDPEEMMRQEAWVSEEMARRDPQAVSNQSGDATGPVR